MPSLDSGESRSDGPECNGCAEGGGESAEALHCGRWCMQRQQLISGVCGGAWGGGE